MLRAIFAAVTVATALGFAIGAHAQGGQLPPGFTLTCQFNAGALAGQTKTFPSGPGVVPAQIGQPCYDGQTGSTGVAVAPPGQTPPNPNPTGPAATPSPPSKATTFKCKFSAGSLAGQTKDFSGIPGVVPAQIGQPCFDGPTGSTGTAVQ